MLNIISRSIVSKHTRGPRKVVLNLMKGLDEIGYPYVVNADLNATKSLWIHDDLQALKSAVKLPTSVSIVAGPNIYTLPSEIPNTIDISRIIWIHPALWVQKFWEAAGDKNIPSIVWPVGIDTKKFSPSATTKKDLILVYNKQRADEDVETICHSLKARGEKYQVITYGQYREEEYQKLLEQSKAIIWVGRSESQGIAQLEALAMNVPVLVWDVSVFGDWEGGGKERFSKEELAFSPVTAVPYFDETCGLRFTAKSDLLPTLETFLEKISTFTPRAYIERELSLSKQAKAFLDIYKTNFKQTDEILKDTYLANTKKWRNASWCFYLRTALKDAIRHIIR